MSFRQVDEVSTLKRNWLEYLQLVRATIDKFEQRIVRLNVFCQQKICFRICQVFADSFEQMVLNPGVRVSNQAVSSQTVAFQVPCRAEFLFASD